jgi:hypothetical protein
MDTSTATQAVSHSVTTTDSWVYLFSKFTHEAMLFQALAICLGIFGYAVFYLIQKRKYGVAGKEIESGVVKVYLAQLVADAEEMRNQLFGLLGKGEASARLLAGMQFQAGIIPAPTEGAGATAAGAPAVATQLVQDPKLQEKLKELEKKLADQANALDSVLNEKMKLEEELAGAKDDTKGGTPGGPDKSGPLQERVKQLESQLAEYAIIEDDLANLKRLQKENKTLKQQLSDVTGGTPVAKAAAPETPAAATPKTETPPVETPNLEAAPEAPNTPTIEASAAPEVTPKVAAPDLSEASNPDTEMAGEASKHGSGADPTADFESLVDVVEKNLADAAKSDSVDKTAAAATPELNLDAAPAVAATDIAKDAPNVDQSSEKTEEQLQADFEKMLNS